MLKNYTLALVLWLCFSTECWATFIFFSPGTAVSHGPEILIDNRSVVGSSSSSNSTGSGLAVASISSLNTSIGGNVSVGLQTPEPGSATASIFSELSYDLIFPRPGRFLLPIDIATRGRIQIDQGDDGFAIFQISNSFPTLDFEFEDKFSILQCSSTGGCENQFSSNSFDLFVDVDKSLRLPVVSILKFDIGVSRPITVSEPAMIGLVLIGLATCFRLSRRQSGV